MYLNISPAGWYLIGASILFLVLFFLFVLFYFMVKQKQSNMLIKEQKTKSEYEQLLLNTQIEIQEQTLKTISQEIHDNVGQVLSLAKLNLNTFEANPESKLKNTKELVSKAINDLRDLSRSLHGDKMAEIGLQEAITNELRILQNTGQFETQLKVTGEAYKLEPQKEMVLYRIVQEALHNSVKHAKAGKLQALLNYQPALFTLTITDDGRGFDMSGLQSSKTGIGLKSMQNRAALIGGEFSIQSSEKNGTSISIRISNNLKL